MAKGLEHAPDISHLRILADAWRATAETCEARARSVAKRCGEADGRFDRGQAASLRNCADSLERVIAPEAVADMLQRCPEVQQHRAPAMIVHRCDGKDCKHELPERDSGLAAWVSITPRRGFGEDKSILGRGTLHLCPACWARVVATLATGDTGGVR